MDIDKGAFKPIYLQIKDILHERIVSGTYETGNKIPSENQLAQEFQVTRSTIRNAIKELKNDGYLHSIKGKGILVNPPKIEQSLLKFYSFGRDISKISNDSSSKIIHIRKIPGSEDLLEKLKKKDPVYEMIRVRYLNEVPLILESSYIPESFANDLLSYDLENNSLYDILEKINATKITHAVESLEPTISNSFESHLLHIPLHSPVFKTERVTYILDMVPLEVRKSLIRGDKFKFTTVLK